MSQCSTDTELAEGGGRPPAARVGSSSACGLHCGGSDCGQGLDRAAVEPVSLRWLGTMQLSVPLALTLTLALPAGATAAVKAGSYSGTSSGKHQEYGKLEMSTDKGKVKFAVRSGKVVKFKVSGQLFQCGTGGHEIPVAVAKIKLNASGRGTAQYKNPDVGAFAISVKVTSRGTASGTITPKGLCSGPVKFTAKRR